MKMLVNILNAYHSYKIVTRTTIIYILLFCDIHKPKYNDKQYPNIGLLILRDLDKKMIEYLSHYFMLKFKII